MFLTQDQVYLILCEFTNLSYREVDQELVTLKNHSSGQYSILLMPTGNKLKYDTHRDKFYLDGYAWMDVDNIYIYDSLEIIEDYWDFLADDYSEEEIETRKKYYQGYKESIDYQVA